MKNFLFFIFVIFVFSEPRKFNVEGVAKHPLLSHGSIIGSTLYTSGILATHLNGSFSRGIEAETKQVLYNLDLILRHVGCSRKDVGLVNIWVSFQLTPENFGILNRVYENYFSQVTMKPARATVGGQVLANNAMVEIAFTAQIN